MSGIVYLVGAGPGDPGLITRRAAELLQIADLVAVDALVTQEIVDLIPPNAERVFVGKRAGAHSVPQDATNALLVEEARKGKRVVRLKGGDPFVFGRGGEEAEELAAAGVRFEVVPGISSAIAGPAYAGIPVTHRSYAAALTLVTGHEADGTTGVDWTGLAAHRGTVVFLMGFSNLETIVEKLTGAGAPADRPVAVVSNATRPEQRTVVGTLASIAEKVRAAELATPALVVVGNVVALRETINWFESRPLFGRTVVVTRAREQASELRRLLESSGARVVQFPTIEIAPPESFESLDRMLVALNDYQWLVFTSVNGVRAFFDRLHVSGRDARALAGSLIAAVGDTTAAALRERGIAPDLVPEKFQSASLLPHFEGDQSGVRVALIRAADGANDFPDEMRRRGATVDLVVAYRNLASTGDLARLPELFEADSVDAVTFTSGSTVENFYAALSEADRELVHRRAAVISIGPVTSQALRRFGKEPDVEATSASVQALHDALVEYLRGSA